MGVIKKFIFYWLKIIKKRNKNEKFSISLSLCTASSTYFARMSVASMHQNFVISSFKSQETSLRKKFLFKIDISIEKAFVQSSEAVGGGLLFASQGSEWSSALYFADLIESFDFAVQLRSFLLSLCTWSEGCRGLRRMLMTQLRNSVQLG